MTAIDSGSVLRRLARPAPPAPAPVTPARALRLALTRAAERSAGLGLTVLGVTEEVAGLDIVLAQVGGDMMLLALWGDSGLAGLVGVDLELRTALVEVQTMGRLRAQRAESRPVTATDAALSQPLVAAFLMELGQATQGTPLEGWAEGHRVDGRIAGRRAAELDMPDVAFRLVRLTLDLAAGDRQGELLLALPALRRGAELAQAPPPAGAGFAARLRQNVLQAEAALDAVLTRLRVPLRQAEVLEVGQLIALPGVTVSSLRLEGPDGRLVAQGRLGQSAGMRAVRVEVAALPGMIETSLPGSAAGPLSPGHLGRAVGTGLALAARGGHEPAAGAEPGRPGLR